MELKDFIKNVLADITNAVKESQEELTNGAIISPSSTSKESNVNTKDGRLRVSEIDFEVSVCASSSNGSGGKINVAVAVIKGGTGSESKTSSENISKVKFSIPVIYPTFKVVEKSSSIGPRIVQG